jgi:hypothetical protein
MSCASRASDSYSIVNTECAFHKALHRGSTLIIAARIRELRPGQKRSSQGEIHCTFAPVNNETTVAAESVAVIDRL